MLHDPHADCPACAASRVRSSDEFCIGCSGCVARAASRSLQFHLSQRAGRLLPEYRAMLQRLGVTHEQVKAAHAADFDSAQTAVRLSPAEQAERLAARGTPANA